MGKASQAKKVNRAAATGGGRTSGKNTPVAWYASLFLIVVLGVLGVFVGSRNLGNTEAAAESVPPVANKDHWHAAYGFNLCGRWAPSLRDAKPDASGIHTHEDGLIHTHPFTRSAAGRNADFGEFMETTNISVTATSLDLRREGEKFKNGDRCDKKRGELTWWVFDNLQDTEPRKMSGNPANWRIRDGAIIAISFNPRGFKIEQPPSAPEVANPKDLETPPTPGETPTTNANSETSVPTETTTTPAETTPTTQQ